MSTVETKNKKSVRKYKLVIRGQGKVRRLGKGVLGYITTFLPFREAFTWDKMMRCGAKIVRPEIKMDMLNAYGNSLELRTISLLRPTLTGPDLMDDIEYKVISTMLVRIVLELFKKEPVVYIDDFGRRAHNFYLSDFIKREMKDPIMPPCIDGFCEDTGIREFTEGTSHGSATFTTLYSEKDGTNCSHPRFVIRYLEGKNWRRYRVHDGYNIADYVSDGTFIRVKDIKEYRDIELPVYSDKCIRDLHDLYELSLKLDT